MIDELVKVIGEISQYTSEKDRTVLSKVLDGTRLMADEWNTINPQTDEQVTNFYRLSRSQIYGLAGYNYFNRSRYLLSHKIAERCYGRVLDFGAGIGDNLIRLWRRGIHDLTHADLAGYTRNFAAWRYAARGMEPAIVSPDEIEGRFDCIIFLDVVEHVLDPLAILDKLVSHLAVGGKIFMNAHFGKTEKHPMHFACPTSFSAVAYLASLGLDQTNVLTASDLLNDVIKEAQSPITTAELKYLLRTFPGNLDLLLLCVAAASVHQTKANGK